MLSEILVLILFALLAAALMMAGHYLAPRIAGRELHRIEAYVCGCLLGILVPFWSWCLLWSHVSGSCVPVWLPAVALLVVTGGAGAGTVAAWAADAWSGARADARLRGPDGQS
jgi:hypothetical protein